MISKAAQISERGEEELASEAAATERFTDAGRSEGAEPAIVRFVSRKAGDLAVVLHRKQRRAARGLESPDRAKILFDEVEDSLAVFVILSRPFDSRLRRSLRAGFDGEGSPTFLRRGFLAVLRRLGMTNQILRPRRLAISALGEERHERLRHARREVVPRLCRDDECAASFGIAQKSGSDSASPLRSIDRQQPQIFAADHRQAFEIAKDADSRRPLKAGAKTLLFGDAADVVRLVVGVDKKPLNSRQVNNISGSNHAADYGLAFAENQLRWIT